MAKRPWSLSKNPPEAYAHALGRNSVGRVEGLLPLTPAVGFAERGLEGTGHGVGVENDPAIDVARGAADGLDQ